jgi:hypothetical protein
MLIAEPFEFRAALDRIPQRLNHALAATGLFTLTRIADLVENIFRAGEAKRLSLLQPLDHPGEGFSKRICRAPHPGVIGEFATTRCWLGIRDPGAVDPSYRDVYRQVIYEAGRLAGQPLLEHSCRGHLTLIVSSPGVVTPYHLDFEHNLLCQIVGEKKVSLWRPDDRATLSETEIEQFYRGNPHSLRWRQGQQSSSLAFELAPGDALYQPPLAPHWVLNGSTVSISASFTFSAPPIERRARIYQANPYFRRIGIVPPPPGQSALADHARLAVMATVICWKRWRSRRRVAPKGLE